MLEKRHVMLFGELVQARRTTRVFTKCSHLDFKLIFSVIVDYENFSKNPMVDGCTRWIFEISIHHLLYAPWTLIHCYSLSTNSSRLKKSKLSKEIFPVPNFMVSQPIFLAKLMLLDIYVWRFTELIS